MEVWSLVIVVGLVLPASVLQADALSGLESYAEWTDVTNQSSIGAWTKTDGSFPVTDQGELVSAPAHGSVVPRTGSMLLDLRTEDSYEADNANNGADYHYAMNVDDFDGVDPTSMTSGTAELNFWICPDTWSGDIGFFTPSGIYQTTSLLNSNGDVLAAVGMFSLGNSNTPEVHYSVDRVNWTSTGLVADSSSWTNVSLFVDLDAKTSRIGFTDASSNAFTSPDLAWSGGITDTSVTTLNLQQVDGVGKNYFDDFNFSVNVSSVPEPSSFIVGLVFAGAVVVRRRRVCHV